MLITYQDLVQDGFQSFVMVENTGVIIQTSNFNLNTARFIISSSDVGVIAVGSTPPLDYNNGKGFYVDGDGNLLIGNSHKDLEFSLMVLILLLVHQIFS